MDAWDEEAKLLLKAELQRSGVSYKMLAAKLEAIGVVDNEAAISNRISRGKFSLSFFMQCMHVLGVEAVNVKSRKAARAK